MRNGEDTGQTDKLEVFSGPFPRIYASKTSALPGWLCALEKCWKPVRGLLSTFPKKRPPAPPISNVVTLQDATLKLLTQPANNRKKSTPGV